MPKIKDLGVTSIAFAGAEREGARGRGYWLCSQTQCDQPSFGTPPQCHPTPQCEPTCPTETCPPPSNGPGKKNARGVPRHAVTQIKQQIHQISRQLHN
jgi:hypothetical protein